MPLGGKGRRPGPLGPERTAAQRTGMVGAGHVAGVGRLTPICRSWSRSLGCREDGQRAGRRGGGQRRGLTVGAAVAGGAGGAAALALHFDWLVGVGWFSLREREWWATCKDVWCSEDGCCCVGDVRSWRGESLAREIKRERERERKGPEMEGARGWGLGLFIYHGRPRLALEKPLEETSPAPTDQRRPGRRGWLRRLRRRAPARRCRRGVECQMNAAVRAATKRKKGPWREWSDL